jgi:hypothetical protein
MSDATAAMRGSRVRPVGPAGLTNRARTRPGGTSRCPSAVARERGERA